MLLGRHTLTSDVFGQRALPLASRPSGRGMGVRLIIGLVVAAFALCSYFGHSEFNPVTGEKQFINITQEQEIALGLQSVPQMAEEYGGLHPDQQAQALVNNVGAKIVSRSEASGTQYPFKFYLLADEQTVNAFALPGGPVFITAGLLSRLQTEGQLAAVLGHEIGHVVARHSAQQIAKQQLTQGLTGAVVLSSYDPNNPSSQRTAQIAMVIGQLVNLKFSREDELQADHLGLQFMYSGNYDPRAMLGLMEILNSLNQGGRPPEFLATHPNPENRSAQIEQDIQEKFPNGIPGGLIP
jgi:beta-barrel assembly-enhancing protease